MVGRIFEAKILDGVAMIMMIIPTTMASMNSFFNGAIFNNIGKYNKYILNPWTKQ
jgi:hypothetical protein